MLTVSSDQSAQDSFFSQVKSLQLKTIATEEMLKKKENELNQLKDDFEAYKIRAHNVLQKRKTEHNAKNNEEKLQSEIDVLGQTIKELRKRLEDTMLVTSNLHFFYYLQFYNIFYCSLEYSH